MNTLLASITATQSLLNMILAAAISTLMLGFGLYGRRVASKSSEQEPRRRIRGLWIVAGIVASLMTLYVARAETSYGYRDSSAILALGAGALVGLVLGMILILASLRGRWVGEHPHCRRCRFDLFGKPAESTICNECGADLTQPRAVTTGEHHRRLIPLLAGSFLLTLSAAIGVSVGSGITRSSGSFSLTPFKPTWWLTLDPNDIAFDNSVQAELFSRLRAGKLSAAAIERVAASAESVAKGRTRSAQFADAFALQAWRNGSLSEATIRRALRRQLELNTDLAPTPTPTCIPYTCWGGNYYWWAGSRPLTYEVTDRVCTINGTEIPSSCIGNTLLNPPGVLSPFGDVIRLPSPLPMGPVNVKLTVHATVTLTVPGRPTLTEANDVTLIDRATAINDLAPREFNNDPAPDSDMGATAAVITLSTPAADPTATRLDIRFATQSGGMFAGDAFVRSRNGTERKLGQVVIQSGIGSVSATLPPPALDPVFEIVLRPTNELAAELVWTPQTYQHEIVIAAPTLILTKPDSSDPAAK